MKQKITSLLAAACVALASPSPGNGTLPASVQPEAPGEAGGAGASCAPSTAANRERVLAFYRQGLVEKDVRAAFERYVAPHFVEHKPDIPVGDRASVIEFLEGIVRDLPDARWDILRTVAEDDLVFVHARFTPGPGAPPYALADLFRVEDCAIVEHWDVVEAPRDGRPNPNSQF
jgi:predicted SnoaL-like aldol condensation-catalyzing enzyme